MPEGDLITAAGQYELRGLLLGRGTDYPVENVEGLLLPAVRSADLALDGADGAHPGVDTLDVRQVILTIGVRADSRAGLAAKLDALAEAWAPVAAGGETVPFVFRMATGRTRRLNVKPRRLAGPWGYTAPHGSVAGVVGELIAPDPYAYDQTLQTVTWNIANGATSESQNVTNDGSGRTFGTITLGGPAVNPRIRNMVSERSIRLDVTLAAADLIELDLDAKTIRHKVGAGAWTRDDSLAASDNEWWTLAPGTQALTYSRDDASAPATATVDFRNGYIAAL